MPNPLYKTLAENNPAVAIMIHKFNKFKGSFKGDPKQIVMQMVNSGRISQDQLNQLQQKANEFQKFLK